jgi:hypothetical protein
MAAVKFTVRQRDHLVPTLICVIEFTLGTTCLTINISNFLATFFRQLLALALVSLTIRVMHFLLLIEIQKHSGVSTRSIFRSNLHITARNPLSCPPICIRHNLCITTRNSLSCPPVGICYNLCIIMRSSLSCPPVGIHYNLRITTHNSLSCPSICICHNLRVNARNSLSCPSVCIRCNLRIATRSSLSYLSTSICCTVRIAARNSLNYPLTSIHHTLLLKSSSMLLSGKMVSTDAWVLQRGILLLFVHWFNEGCCVDRGR